jgi:serine/threonine protein kinase
MFDMIRNMLHKMFHDENEAVYTVVSAIQEGGFSSVLLVSKNDKTFALKKVSYQHSQHIKNEVKVLRHLPPNCNWAVNMECTFSTHMFLCLVIEYVEGGDFMSLLIEKDRLTLDELIPYIVQMMSAISSLHKLGFIHRDIKPDNLLLSGQTIKLCDFGHSRPISSRCNTIVGTPDYMAPEIMQSCGYDQLIDWWSMGVVVYESLVGHVPFYCDPPNPIMTMNKIVNFDFVYPLFLTSDEIGVMSSLLCEKQKRFVNKLNFPELSKTTKLESVMCTTMC